MSGEEGTKSVSYPPLESLSPRRNENAVVIPTFRERFFTCSQNSGWCNHFTSNWDPAMKKPRQIWRFRVTSAPKICPSWALRAVHFCCKSSKLIVVAHYGSLCLFSSNSHSASSEHPAVLLFALSYLSRIRKQKLISARYNLSIWRIYQEWECWIFLRGQATDCDIL